jgi:hypothetical protein
MGFLNGRSIEQSLEDEERFEAETARERAKHSLERERMLRRLEEKEGKESWKMYSTNGAKSGIDWELLRSRASVPGAKSIAQAPSFRGRSIND